ncbi:MAG TPA: MFS transporter [Planctomycetaceae bacterium]|jgi:MFS family permease|nr:MFS transporter [Planctomycetaceae bacterium]
MEPALLDPPRRGRRFSFDYGWIVVVLAALAMTATLPGRTHGLGLITEPLLADLGIERTVFGRINLTTCLLGTVFCLPAGFLLDRFGIRIATACTVFLLGLSVVGMATANSTLSLTLWLVLVRGVGQSALSIVSMAAVGKWFQGRRLGIAMGVYAILLTFGFIASVEWLGWAVAKYGWRTAWAQLGWSLLLGMLPLTLLLARSAPQEVDVVADSPLINATDCPPVDFTFGQAIHTSAFWIIAVGAGAFNLIWSALTLFNQSILEEHGFDEKIAVNVLAMLVGTGLVSNLVGGALIRRKRVGWLLGFGLAVLSAALFWFPSVMTTPALLCYAAGIGVAGGLVTVVFFAAWGSVFGRASVGRIQGLAQLITVVASAIGPDLMAEGRAVTESYTSMFYAVAALTLVLALAAFFVRIPTFDVASGAEMDLARLAAAPVTPEI